MTPAKARLADRRRGRQTEREAREAAALRALEVPERDVQTDRPLYRVSPDDPGEYIRALIEQSEGIQAETPPSWTKPGLFSRWKMPNAMQADAQQEYVFDQLLAAYGAPTQPGVIPERWSGLPDEMQSTLMAYATDADGFRTAIKSKDEWTGVLGEGSPLNTAMTWAQSLPSMAYGAGQGLANATDYVVSSATGGIPGTQYPKAGERFQTALDTFTAPGQELARVAGYGPQRNESVWTAMRDARKRNDADVVPFAANRVFYEPSAYGPRGADRKHWSDLSDEVQQTGKQLDGIQYLTEAQVPGYVAYPLGMFMDDLLNPFLDAPGMRSAIRSGSGSQLARRAAVEFGPSQALMGTAAVGQAVGQSRQQAEIDKMLQRLAEAREGR